MMMLPSPLLLKLAASLLRSDSVGNELQKKPEGHAEIDVASQRSCACGTPCHFCCFALHCTEALFMKEAVVRHLASVRDLQQIRMNRRERKRERE